MTLLDADGQPVKLEALYRHRTRYRKLLAEGRQGTMWSTLYFEDGGVYCVDVVTGRHTTLHRTDLYERVPGLACTPPGPAGGWE